VGHELVVVSQQMLAYFLDSERADLDHSGQPQPSYLRSDEVFRQEYRQLAERVTRTLQLDLRW
jgi:hypothetical protein